MRLKICNYAMHSWTPSTVCRGRRPRRPGNVPLHPFRTYTLQKHFLTACEAVILPPPGCRRRQPLQLVMGSLCFQILSALPTRLITHYALRINLLRINCHFSQYRYIIVPGCNIICATVKCEGAIVQYRLHSGYQGAHA